MTNENEMVYYRNDIPLPFTCTVKKSGVVYDLTGYVMTMTVKYPGSSSVVLTKTAVLTVPNTSGIGTFTFINGDLNIPVGEYEYDVQIELTVNGNVTHRETIIGPTPFIILQDLTA